MEEERINVLAGISLQCETLDQIAAYIGISPVTLDRWRRDHEEIKQATDFRRGEANAVIVNKLFELAYVQGEWGAISKWLDRYLPVAQTQKIELTGAGGAPMAVALENPYKGLEKNKLERLVEIAAGLDGDCAET
jgi:transposase-like protein